jgi:thymidine kinase
MPLHFKYGTVSSGKTMHLLMTAHSYLRSKRGATLMKPSLDTRSGVEVIQTRVGISRNADVILQPDLTYYIPSTQTLYAFQQKEAMPPSYLHLHTKCILVDEAQFLSAQWVDKLAQLANQYTHQGVSCLKDLEGFLKSLIPLKKSRRYAHTVLIKLL